MKSVIFKGNLKIEGVTKVNVITPQGTSYIYKDTSKGEALALNLEMSNDGKTLSLFVEHPNPCRTCQGQGTYYEDVVGDGGSRMEMACDDCNANNPLIDGDE